MVFNATFNNILAIVLPVLLRYMTSDYPFGIFKLLAVVLSVLWYMTSDYLPLVSSNFSSIRVIIRKFRPKLITLYVYGLASNLILYYYSRNDSNLSDTSDHSDTVIYMLFYQKTNGFKNFFINCSSPTK